MLSSGDTFLAREAVNKLISCSRHQASQFHRCLNRRREFPPQPSAARHLADKVIGNARSPFYGDENLPSTFTKKS
jgi:hypothetical protein